MFLRESWIIGNCRLRLPSARALLAARGIEVSAGFPGVSGFAEFTGGAIMDAASACVSEADFRKRLHSR